MWTWLSLVFCRDRGSPCRNRVPSLRDRQILLFLRKFLHILIHSSGNDNPREGSVLFPGFYLHFNSTLFQMIRDSDLTNWADLLCVPRIHPTRHRHRFGVVYTLGRPPAPPPHPSSRSMDRHEAVSRRNLSREKPSCFVSWNHFEDGRFRGTAALTEAADGRVACGGQRRV